MFCKKAKSKIKSILKQFDSYVESHVDIALAVTNEVEKILKSPVASILTAIIPTDVDEMIRIKLIQALGIAVNALSIVDTCKNQPTLEARLQCWMQEVKKLHPELQQAILSKLGSIIARELGGGQLPQNLYDLFTQAKFSAEK